MPTVPYLCHECDRPALDAARLLEVDGEGNTWVYCRACDAWTSHPPATEPAMPPDPPPAAPSAERDLSTAIRQMSDGVTRLLASGLNRRAIVTLLADSTKVGRRDIERVLDGLADLEKDFTTVKLVKSPPSTPLPTRPLSDGCHAGKDGECNWHACPQERDGEPKKSGRHCPLDDRDDEV